MGREIRMVPPEWTHPKNDRGRMQPMYDRQFENVFAHWLSDFDRIRDDDLTDIERECYTGDGKMALAEWLRDEGIPPDPSYYRPWKLEDATWVQVWETVSEGTPVTPPFATKNELIDYLVAGGDDWDREIRRGGYSREQATAFVNAGWAPSMVSVDGQIFNAIESASVMSDKKT